MDSIFDKIRNNDVEGLKILIEEEQGEINKPIDEYGRTPLMIASLVGADRRIIDILIKAGPELEAKDVWGRTALHLAVWSGRPHLVEILLSRGSEVNPRDGRGRTPLHLACYYGYLHIVELLLGHNGIDANVVHKEGDTPLHWAVRGQRYDTVLKMLNKTKRFHSEVEPLSILDKFCKDLKLGNEERCSGVVVACYLAHHGANFYCKNKIGRTPLDLIEKENLKKTLKTLFPPQCVFCEDEIISQIVEPQQNLASSSNILHLITLCSFTIFLGYMTTSIRTVIMVPMFHNIPIVTSSSNEKPSEETSIKRIGGLVSC
ncbi:E3 ubiquitin-protein ligase MIB2-like isoform X3 [Octopus vulgaris]|uniref:E3 ubiquitin-protein ligase MIB2-like isoform X3 n=1 Tax=Octopus vulgaris TaxID=6645 RepID=A0AA36MI42_OCTVU|nr:E3 ubiquitin-protein ligase MIB2-like isoform X3 [Octopus vulgaris]